jgi:hypothetical protein
VDVGWSGAVLSLGVGIGLAAAAGLRVFLPLLVLGLASRFGALPLAGGFDWLATGPTLVVLGAATVFEIGAYYLPWIDNLLDLLAAPLAVMAGILLTAAVATDLPPEIRWGAAIIAGGGTAGIVQGLTSLTRLKSTALTAGAANPVLSTIELVGSFATSMLAIAFPVVALLVVVASVAIVRRVARRLWRRAPVQP